MLLSLKIQNLVLIESASIDFGPGLNILTGETGSGKSAVLSAIRLLAGERSDAQLIRKGADLAVVEALFSSLPAALLAQEGIEAAPPFTVRREICRSGKNRCFIEERQVSLSFLKEALSPSIQRIDQSSSRDLCSADVQRSRLDAFADLSLSSFTASYAEEKKLEALLETLIQAGSQRDRDLKWAQEDLAAIEEVNWLEGEEEKLSAEHRLLSHAQELLEKLGSFSSALLEGQTPIAPLLKRQSALLEQCSRFDPKLAPLSESFKNASLELEEAGHALRSYVERLDADPQKLSSIESRIAEIESIKKRFGPTFEDAAKRKKALQDQIDSLSSLDEQIASARSSLELLRKKNHHLASELSRKRKTAAHKFQPLILAELKSLNLPNAQFSVLLEPKPLSSTGADSIRFLFSANPGVSPIPLEECASGGELSRLLLAIEVILAEKEGKSCLVFDEIDSNVGGQTAAVLGEKLRQLSQGRQVLCVTHFLQVAKCALDHFLVSKKERQGQAFTLIQKLEGTAKESEYRRMQGLPV